MSSRMEKISELLLEEVEERFDKEPLDIDGLEFGESFAEMLDRFLIMHIRMWKIEDGLADAKTDTEVATLVRKTEYLFKDRRPKLIAAINSFLDVYVGDNGNRVFSEENVKLYKGFDNS